MHKKPIESRNTIDAYPNGDFYRVCMTCEAIENFFKNHDQIEDFAVDGWKYVKTAEANGFPTFLPHKFKYLALMSMQELQDGRWCKECGATVWLPTFLRINNQTIELSITLEKDELQIDKVTFTLPGSVDVQIPGAVQSIGNLVIYDEEGHEHLPLLKVTDTEHRVMRNGVLVAKLTFPLSMDEATLIIYNKTEEKYSQQTTYAVEIDKTLIRYLDTIGQDELLYSKTFISEAGLSIEHRNYVGYISLSQFPFIGDNIITKISEIINRWNNGIKFSIIQNRENAIVTISFTGSFPIEIDTIKREIHDFLILYPTTIEYMVTTNTTTKK